MEVAAAAVVRFVAVTAGALGEAFEAPVAAVVGVLFVDTLAETVDAFALVVPANEGDAARPALVDAFSFWACCCSCSSEEDKGAFVVSAGLAPRRAAAAVDEATAVEKPPPALGVAARFRSATAAASDSIGLACAVAVVGAAAAAAASAVGPDNAWGEEDTAADRLRVCGVAGAEGTFPFAAAAAATLRGVTPFCPPPPPPDGCVWVLAKLARRNAETLPLSNDRSLTAVLWRLKAAALFTPPLVLK